MALNRNKSNYADSEAATPGRPECDPAKLAPVNEFDARPCPDDVYRNRWGCHFCSVEGCGLVSDMVLGGQELCVFHAAAQRSTTEMTEVIHQYRPLIILAKGFDKLPNLCYLQKDEGGLTVADELFEEFRALVERSGFDRLPKGMGADLPLPRRRSECEKGNFVTPFAYVLNGCVAHANARAAIREANRGSRKSAASASITRVNRLRERINSLGATWRKVPKNELANNKEVF